jgi:hypothetical protein
VDSGADLDAVAKRKFPAPFRNLSIVVHSVALSLYRRSRLGLLVVVTAAICSHKVLLN